MYLSCCGCISGRFPFRQIYIFRLKHCCRNNREIVKLFSNFYFRSLYVLFLVVRFCFVLYVVLCFFLVLLSWLLVFLSCSSVCFFFLILLSSSSFLFFYLLLLSCSARGCFFFLGFCLGGDLLFNKRASVTSFCKVLLQNIFQTHKY